MSSATSEVVEENFSGHESSHHSNSSTFSKMEIAENTQENYHTDAFQNIEHGDIEGLARDPAYSALQVYNHDQHVSNGHDIEDSYAATPMIKRMIPVQSNDNVNEGRISFTADMPRLANYIDSMYKGSEDNGNHSPNMLPQLAEYLEPIYATFFCPLTKKVMVDPVTIESGVSFERNAISEWFENFKDDLESVICPTTGMKLEIGTIHPNIALRTTIAEWKERNEATRVRVARTALSLATSEAMILDAVRDLRILGQRRKENKEQIHEIGITKQLTRFLEHRDMTVRCETLDLLRLLVEDEEGKVIVGGTKAIARTTKMLSSTNVLERHASVSLLLELSKSETLLKSIGSTAGCILMLNNMKYNEISDPHAAEKAGETLQNLEKFSRNIKLMAENGLLGPLLVHLVDGSEETQMEMVGYLSELVLEDDMKTYVAERASQALIKMVHSGTTPTRKAAFNALVQISSHHPNSQILVDAGIVPIMIEEIFTRKIHNEPMDSKEEAAAILAHIVESKIDLETIEVNKHGHTITSNYSIYNISHLLKSSTSYGLNTNLIRMLLSLAELPKPLVTVVSVIKEIEVIRTIIEFLNSPSEELNIVAAKFLIILSTHMGHTIAEALCKTKGQPEALITNYDTEHITENHSVSVILLAKLPHQNLTLNLALLNRGTVPVILSRIGDVLRGETRRSRYARQYLEGLVGILVRFTTTLFEHDILEMAIQRNLTSVFTNLLARTGGSDEVQRLAASGLENLSFQSIHLSRAPDETKDKKKVTFFKLGSQKDVKRNQSFQLCPIHRGVCSSSTTFCLLEAKSVDKLLLCLEHEDAKVVQAALSAISTLLDDSVDVEKSVGVLVDSGALRHVLRVLREHREEDIWQKTFWIIEKFLANGGSDNKIISEISNDKVLPSALVTAFHRGSSNTKELAQIILRYLNKMPQFSTTFTQ